MPLSPLLIATTNPGKIREIRLILDDVPQRLVTLADLPPMPEPEETGTTFAENAVLKARYYADASGLATVAEDSGLAIDALGGRPGVHSARYPGETYADKFANLFHELAPHARPWTARFVCSLAVVRPLPTRQASEDQASGARPHDQASGHRPRASEAQSSGDRAPGHRPQASVDQSPGGGNRASADQPRIDAAAELTEIEHANAPRPAVPLRPEAHGPRPDEILFTAEATVEGEITSEPRGANGFGYDPIFYYPPYGGTLAEQDNERKLAVAHRGEAFRALRVWLGG